MEHMSQGEVYNVISTSHSRALQGRPATAEPPKQIIAWCVTMGWAQTFTTMLNQSMKRRISKPERESIERQLLGIGNFGQGRG